AVQAEAELDQVTGVHQVQLAAARVGDRCEEAVPGVADVVADGLHRLVAGLVGGRHRERVGAGGRGVDQGALGDGADARGEAGGRLPRSRLEVRLDWLAERVVGSVGRPRDGRRRLVGVGLEGDQLDRLDVPGVVGRVVLHEVVPGREAGERAAVRGVRTAVDRVADLIDAGARAVVRAQGQRRRRVPAVL